MFRFLHLSFKSIVMLEFSYFNIPLILANRNICFMVTYVLYTRIIKSYESNFIGLNCKFVICSGEAVEKQTDAIPWRNN